ncbi:hypothetical protein G7067_11885 [Leucobacter insecticola]|uniref:DNA polymerase III subunit gamma/tau n=1 Tax=Leucobacter insecticola TaxID=2714934 RepID=A0A6G8FKY2_9MICO|nr:hypothetical protein [Leucobacter insecticola]QIM16943.1 hypothetical protein G7067_11885 [Leucobacter insecticola]
MRNAEKEGAGARESSIASGWKIEEEPNLPAAEDPVGGPGSEEQETQDGAETSVGLSNGALVLFGVFGGLYLLYTWGWFVVAQAYSGMNAAAAAGSGSVGGVLQQILFWAAPLAAPLWFLVSLAAARGGRTKRLALMLCIGAVVLLPLPMLIAKGG